MIKVDKGIVTLDGQLSELLVDVLTITVALKKESKREDIGELLHSTVEDGLNYKEDPIYERIDKAISLLDEAIERLG